MSWNDSYGIYPNGYGSKAAVDQLSVGFGPDCPDYSQIAVAASGGWAWGRRVDATASEHVFEEVITEAVKVVVNEGRCAVVDCCGFHLTSAFNFSHLVT